MAEFHLRRTTTDDLPAINALIPQSVRTLSATLYSPAQIESALRHVFGPDTRLIADGTYYVVTTGTHLVACGGWSRWRTLYGGDQMKKSGDDSLLDPQTEPARIRAFFVAPEFARQGLGTWLLEASLEAILAAGFGTVELVATLPGEKFYAAHGFGVVERLAHKLPDGLEITFVRMRKTLAAVAGGEIGNAS